MISAGLFGCLFDGGVSWEDKEYHVGRIDADENALYCTISNGGPMKVEPTIISVGSNDLFVVVKRRLDASRIQYYYIQKGPNGSSPCTADRTHGPFNATQFTAITEELNLPSFEKNFE